MNKSNFQKDFEETGYRYLPVITEKEERADEIATKILYADHLEIGKPIRIHQGYRNSLWMFR